MMMPSETWKESERSRSQLIKKIMFYPRQIGWNGSPCPCQRGRCESPIPMRGRGWAPYLFQVHELPRQMDKQWRPHSCMRGYGRRRRDSETCLEVRLEGEGAVEG